jgi:hypothetical protein
MRGVFVRYEWSAGWPRTRFQDLWVSAFTLAVLLAVLPLAGCGSSGDPCSINGSVTFGGAPVEDGNIAFIPEGQSESPGAGVKIIGGRYDIPLDVGLWAGKYRVSITAIKKTGRKVAAPEVMEGGAEKIEEVIQYIPARYNSSSELQLDLAPGENSHDFNLAGG